MTAHTYGDTLRHRGLQPQRFVRFLVYTPYYQHWALKPLLKRLHAIPVGAGREAVTLIRAARQELQHGHLVCIFAEGAIS